MLDVLLDAEPLSEVRFVHDYVHLVFQGTTLSCYNPVSVQSEGGPLTRLDSGFCDGLCRLIGHRVVDTVFVEGVKASVRFANETVVSISLTPGAGVGPEAFMLSDQSGLCVVEQNA